MRGKPTKFIIKIENLNKEEKKQILKSRVSLFVSFSLFESAKLSLSSLIDLMMKDIKKKYCE